MNVFTRPEIAELFGGGEGVQLANALVRNGIGKRIYLPVDERRLHVEYEFDGRKLEDVARLWRYFEEKQVEKPVYSDRILWQAGCARFLGETLRLFSPWGARYRRSSPRIERDDAEIATLQELRDILAAIKSFGYDVSFLLMPADAYATEINNLPKEFVDEYFAALRDAAFRELEDSVLVKPWSEIRVENSADYAALKAEAENSLRRRGSLREKYYAALKAARNFNPRNAAESARKYCAERFAEGCLIAQLFDPIKLSLVRKEKDALDGPLKRLYVVRNRAPWLR